jgi:amicoumacin kinase
VGKTIVKQRELVESAELRNLALACGSHWTESRLEFVRNFDNLVYRLQEQRAYLRITSETRRSTAQIESELEIILHAGANGVVASQPIPSSSGKLTHAIQVDGTTYTACVFAEAPGRSFQDSPPKDEATFFHSVGLATGRLHAALEHFEPSPSFIRFDWKEDRWARFAALVPQGEREAWELFEELSDWTAALTTDSSVFGFVHGDLTIANLRHTENEIALFDFDACCRHWYAYEIAIFLHYFGARGPEARKLAYESFFGGYAKARPVSSKLLEQIPLFGKMRLLYSFLVFAEEWGFENLDDDAQAYFELRRRLFRAPPTWPAPSS